MFGDPTNTGGSDAGIPGNPCFPYVFEAPFRAEVEGGARGLPGVLRGPPRAFSASVFDPRGKTLGIRGRGAPIRVENAYELGTPHGAVGRTVLPTLSWAFPAGAREAVPRVLGRFHRNPAGFALGTPPGAVGGKFRPSGSWGVRIGLARVRGSILMIFNGFYR